MLCTTVVHNDMHTCEQFLHCCTLGLDFFLCVYLGFVVCVFFHVSLGHFVLVLLAFVVLGLVSLVLSQEIGREERLRNDLFCVEWDEINLYSVSQSVIYKRNSDNNDDDTQSTPPTPTTSSAPELAAADAASSHRSRLL